MVSEDASIYLAGAWHIFKWLQILRCFWKNQVRVRLVWESVFCDPYSQWLTLGLWQAIGAAFGHKFSMERCTSTVLVASLTCSELVVWAEGLMVSTTIWKPLYPPQWWLKVLQGLQFYQLSYQNCFVAGQGKETSGWDICWGALESCTRESS